MNRTAFRGASILAIVGLGLSACTARTSTANESSGGAGSGASGGAAGEGVSAGTGGSAGTSGEAGSGGGDLPIGPCALTSPAEAEPNDRETPTKLDMSATLQACLDEEGDVDYFEITIPDEGPGGAVALSASDVGDCRVRVELLSSTHTKLVGDEATTNGIGAGVWFEAVSGETYYLKSSEFKAPAQDSDAPCPYDVTFSYTLIDDGHDNATQGGAKDIAVGEPVEGYYFHGIDTDDYGGWYKVALSAGQVTVRLDAPADIKPELSIFSPLSDELGSDWNATYGGSAIVQTSVGAGTHYIKVESFQPFGNYRDGGTGTQLPAHLTDRYVVTVTQ